MVQSGKESKKRSQRKMEDSNPIFKDQPKIDAKLENNQIGDVKRQKDNEIGKRDLPAFLKSNPQQ
jgi:hypothetical protein